MPALRHPSPACWIATAILLVAATASAPAQTVINSGPTGGEFAHFFGSPADPELFVVASIDPLDNRPAWLSVDAGETFLLLDDLPADPPFDGWTAIFDHHDPGFFFLCDDDQDGPKARSTDGGASWTELEISGRLLPHRDPGAPLYLWRNGGNSTAIFTSSNRGDSWQNVPTEFPANWSSSAILDLLAVPGSGGEACSPWCTTMTAMWATRCFPATTAARAGRSLRTMSRWAESPSTSWRSTPPIPRSCCSPFTILSARFSGSARTAD